MIRFIRSYTLPIEWIARLGGAAPLCNPGEFARAREQVPLCSPLPKKVYLGSGTFTFLRSRFYRLMIFWVKNGGNNGLPGYYTDLSGPLLGPLAG